MTVIVACVAIQSLARGGGGRLPQAQAGPRVITATALVRGRVLNPSGAPIRGAEVRVFSQDGRDRRVVTTDADGAYEVRDLTPGAWSIQASKAGYVTQQYGQIHPFATAMPTQVADGQRVTAVLTLMRGGAIAGQVLDDRGEPVLDVSVHALRARMVRGRRQLTAVGAGDRTDDTGAFRLYGLVPGEYYVSATLPARESTPAMHSPDDVVYYPGARSVSAAHRLTLTAGQDHLGVIVSAPRPEQGVRVSGTVLDAQGAPGAGAHVHLYKAEDLSLALTNTGTSVDTDANGRFMATDVAPGSYVVDAMITGGGPAGFEHAALPISVGGADVTGITLTTTRAVAVRAAVVASPPGTALPEDLSLEVTATGTGMYSILQSRMTMLGRTNESASPLSERVLELPGLHGQMRLSVAGLPEGWIVEAIELDGENVTDTLVDFSRMGRPVSARIVISDRTTDIAGTVSEGGRPGRGSVVVFPEDPDKWGYPSRFVRTATADNNGRFSIVGLPPGERYLAVAIDFLEEGEHDDPEFLEQLKDAGTSFLAVEHETVTLDLEPEQR